MRRIASGYASGAPRMKDFDLLTAHAAQNLIIGEKVEAGDLILGAPPSPIPRRVLQRLRHLNPFFRLGSSIYMKLRAARLARK
jgi:hypothetical protein